MSNRSLIIQSDSYKIGGHWNMYPDGTEYVYSYFESRLGAQFANTPFFGLQAIIEKYFVGEVINEKKLYDARILALGHFNGITADQLAPYVTNMDNPIKEIEVQSVDPRTGEKAGGTFKVRILNPAAKVDIEKFVRDTNTTEFVNVKGWKYIINKHKGRLPLCIRSIDEGTPVTVNNVLMSVINTDKNTAWLTNYVESVLTHVWYPSTVAALSRACKEMFKQYLDETSDNPGAINFMLHDFGYRGVSSDESAEAGGSAHLLNFLGTDTMSAMQFAIDYYGAGFDNLAYSVAATEHSIMTALGKFGEEEVVDTLLLKYPKGILSVVIDSYDPYRFVTEIICKRYKDAILRREGVFVVRPDSITPLHPTPESLTLWIVQTLANEFGYTTNSKGYMVLNPKVRVLWGDGIDKEGIRKILEILKVNGFSAENMVFGMGGGLLQKVNRDTQRFAFKSSAQCRHGQWADIFKEPKDLSKASKKGRLALVRRNGVYLTLPEKDVTEAENLLKVRLLDGDAKNYIVFAQARENAKL